MSGAQIINNSWVGYSHNIRPMIKISNYNITKRGTQITGLGIIIGTCSLDCQHGRPDPHPANVGCSFFRYMNDGIRNHNYRRPKRKTWAMEDNQLTLHGNFRSNHSQRGYRKRMIEIWQDCVGFQTTSQSSQNNNKKGMVFWTWNTINIPENTETRQYNTWHVK